MRLINISAYNKQVDHKQKDMQQQSQQKQQQPQQSKPQQKQKKVRKRRKPIQQTQVRKIQAQINDPNFEWDQTQHFEVERIIGQQIWDNKKYYLIKWKGYDISMSTWQQQHKFKSMSDLIENFKKTQKGIRDKNITENANIMMNPYRATQIHGHFLYGDQPDEIVNTIVQFDSDGKKTIYLEISWKNRETQQGQFYLQNSIIQSDIVFDHDPKFLLEYYKKSIQLKPTNPHIIDLDN